MLLLADYPALVLAAGITLFGTGGGTLRQHDIGVVAEDVDEIVPEVVSRDPKT